MRINTNICLAMAAAAILMNGCAVGTPAEPSVSFAKGASDFISPVGRTVVTSDSTIRQWAPGAYFTFAYEGAGCLINITDEQLYGSSYNYLEVIVDNEQPVRFATKGKRNAIVLGSYAAPADTMVNVVGILDSLAAGRHCVTVVRDTETGMGFTELASVQADAIYQWQPATDLKIEFIGNSITCGAESYLDEVPYGQGTWYDRHRAYEGYGPRVARELNAQWMLTSVSGIGLIHSCCDMKVVMPQVYDKVVLCDNLIDYEPTFNPDIVCSCLGQNDGVQDSAAFCSAYVDFLRLLRQRNPQAKLVLLSSPMADATLTDYMQRMLPAIAAEATAQGIADISYYFFSRSFNSGGGGHPDMDEHALIARELADYLKQNVLSNTNK